MAMAAAANPPTATAVSATHPTNNTLAAMANLANLLPTGTVLMFRTLLPSFANNGVCQTSNRCLMATLITFCSITCFLSTFTDSFTDHDGRHYYGFATLKGLYVFNRGDRKRSDDDHPVEGGVGGRDLGEMKMVLLDVVHAFVSVFVFWAYALSDNDVQKCFFKGRGKNWDVLVMNLPIAAGIFSSFLFVVFPTTRRGIGHADVPTVPK